MTVNSHKLEPFHTTLLRRLAQVAVKTPFEILRPSYLNFFSFLLHPSDLQSAAFQLLCKIVSNSKPNQLLEYGFVLFFF